MKILHLIFLVGAFALAYCVLRPYPLLGAGTALVALLVVCFCAGSILFGARKDENVTTKSLLASLLPWVLAGSLLVNGAYDVSNEILHPTAVVDTEYGRAWTVVVVRSWRPGRTNESLYIKEGLNLPRNPQFFYQGEPITVGVKSGALRISWISSISRQ
jgi:hypothetical protein